MIETIIEIDKILFLFINSIHTSFFDRLMFAITQTKTWIPFYLLILIYLTYTFKKKSFIIVGVIAVVVGLSDFTASTLFKKSTKRLRPSHEISLNEKVHIVNGYRGGKYGFFSSHASTTFSFSTFILLLYKKRSRFFFLLPFWAFLVSYSRIYLGVHYPLDIFCGAICGIFYGFLGYKTLLIKKVIKS